MRLYRLNKKVNKTGFPEMYFFKTSTKKFFSSSPAYCSCRLCYKWWPHWLLEIKTRWNAFKKGLRSNTVETERSESSLSTSAHIKFITKVSHTGSAFNLNESTTTALLTAPNRSRLVCNTYTNWILTHRDCICYQFNRQPENKRESPRLTASNFITDVNSFNQWLIMV